MFRASTSAFRLAVASTLTVAGLVAAAPSSVAAVDPCPTAAPVSDAVRDLPVHGLTVSSGTDPDTFTGSVLGVLHDGIAPGVDMIMADLDSPELQRVGGVWAGMSGSPVYTEDGRLLGAVSYGLSVGPSRVAGITPAEQMYALLDQGVTASTARSAATRASLTPQLRSAAVQSGAATQTQADGGMTRLPIPLAVSGLTPERRADSRVLSRLAPAGTRVYAAASAPAPTSSTLADPGTTIAPGSNLAAGLSYGDLSEIAVGTATAVCGGQVLAFGHPFLFSGPANESMHGADAVLVQDDPTLTPFKVANPTAPIGTIVKDRLAGIVGTTAKLPPTIPVTASVSAEGRHRDGRTDVVQPDLLPDLAAFHLLVDTDPIFDRVGPGVSQTRIVVHGTRANGAPFTFDRSDRVADRFDLSFATIFPVFDTVAALQNSGLEKVKLTSVDLTSDITPDYTNYELTRVQVRAPNGTWRTADQQHPVRAVAGDRLRLRATLQRFDTTRHLVVPFTFQVPPGTAGAFGQLAVNGGTFVDGGGDGDFGFAPAPIGGSTAAPASFDDLLGQMQNAPRADDLVATFTYGGGGPVAGKGAPGGPTFVQREQRSQQDRVVLGGVSVPVAVVAPRASRPGFERDGRWVLRNRLSSGAPTSVFSFAGGTGVPLMGDFDGNSLSTPAFFHNGFWRIQPTSNPATTVTLTFGQAGDRPVVGDWNGDGKDEIGVLRGDTFLLRPDLAPASVETSVVLPAGVSGLPVAGDWNGDGVDTVGVEKAGAWTLLRHNATGSGVISFSFGTGGRPVVGDWDRDGRSGVGLYRAGTWSLRSRLTSGGPGLVFQFGERRTLPVVWR